MWKTRITEPNTYKAVSSREYIQANCPLSCSCSCEPPILKIGPYQSWSDVLHL